MTHRCEVCGWDIIPSTLDYIGTTNQGGDIHNYHQSCLEGIALTEVDLPGYPEHVVAAVTQIVLNQSFINRLVSYNCVSLALALMDLTSKGPPLTELKSLFANRCQNTETFNLDRLFDFTTRLGPPKTNAPNYRDLMEQLGATVQLAEICRSLDPTTRGEATSDFVVSASTVIESQLTGPQPKRRQQFTFN